MRFLSYIISKSSNFLKKIFELIFATLYFYIYEFKKCLRFLKSYFKLEILIFLSFVVSFSVDMFNSKALFLTKKASVVKSETHFSREPIENERGKVLKKNSIIGRSWSSAKLFIVQNYTENANGDVPLTVENV